MENEEIDTEKIIDYWIKTSDRDFETMNNMLNSKDYHWALFIGHLVIERLLKAGVVKKLKNHPPFTHDLRRLSKLSEIDFEDRHRVWLDTITAFNLNVRYDSYKHEFYKKCTQEYAEDWIGRIKVLRTWIKKTL